MMRFANSIARWTLAGAPAGATASPLGSSSAVAPVVVGVVDVPPVSASAGAGIAKSAIAARIAAMRP